MYLNSVTLSRIILPIWLNYVVRPASAFRICSWTLHPFGLLGLIGERRPRLLRPAATLAHMLERRRFRLGPRLFGARQEELEVFSDYGPAKLLGLASFAGSAASALPALRRADFRFTAAILPRRSSCRS